VKGARTSLVQLEDLTDEQIGQLQKEFERVRVRAAMLRPSVTLGPRVATHPPGLSPLTDRPLERAIGVISLPRTERTSHYFKASLPAPCDAVIDLDEFPAVVSVDPSAV